MKASDECKDQLAQPSWAEGVPAPVDRDGNVVPLTTRTLYDGNGREVEVAEIALVDSILRGRLVWRVRTHSGVSLELDLLSLERPDSWEGLLEDLTRAVKDEEFYSIACAYTNSRSNTCGDCKLRGSCGRCTRGMLEDVADRVRKLSGE